MKEKITLMVQESTDGGVGRIKIYNDTVATDVDNYERRFCTPDGDGMEFDKLLLNLKNGDSIDIVFPDVCERSPDKKHCPHHFPNSGIYGCCWCGQMVTIDPLEGHGCFHPDRKNISLDCCAVCGHPKAYHTNYECLSGCGCSLSFFKKHKDG